MKTVFDDDRDIIRSLKKNVFDILCKPGDNFGEFL